MNYCQNEVQKFEDHKNFKNVVAISKPKLVLAFQKANIFTDF